MRVSLVSCFAFKFFLLNSMNMNKISKLGLILAAGAIPAVNALAGVFVITDDACPAAKGDLEAHLNWESDIATSHSRNIGTGVGLEFAYGATETLEVAASLDFGWAYSSSHFERKTGEPRVNDSNLTGISLGLKNQILDPEKEENAFGLAMVGGFSWGWADESQNSARDIAFSLGLNFQKNLADGDLILAFTPSVEFATSKGAEGGESTDSSVDSIAYSLAGGFSYQVAEGLRFGVEAEWAIEYSDGYDDDAFYAGPNFCYEAESWWITACVAPRWFGKDEALGHDVRVVVQLGYAF